MPRGGASRVQPGQRYGRWLVINRLPDRGGTQLWRTQCECGAYGQVAGQQLYDGRSRQCRACGAKQGAVRRSKTLRARSRRYDTEYGPMTIREIAEKTDMSEETVRTRIKRGESPTTPLKNVKHRLTHNGVTHNLKGWGDIFGISRERVRQRIKAGETIAEIADYYLRGIKPPREKRGKGMRARQWKFVKNYLEKEMDLRDEDYVEEIVLRPGHMLGIEVSIRRVGNGQRRVRIHDAEVEDVTPTPQELGLQDEGRCACGGSATTPHADNCKAWPEHLVPVRGINW